MSDTLRGATVLNVDDEPGSRYVVSRILERAGARVVEAGSGEAALEAVARQSVDVILLDVNLPGIDGLEVTRRLKADPATAGIPILHVSASAIDDESVVRGLEGGADGYLTTPVVPAVLLSTTRALLRMRRATQEAERRAEEAEAARESLREGKAALEGYRLLFRHALDIILFIRRDGRIIEANAAAERAYGRSREELCSLTIRDLRAAETRYKIEEQMRAADGRGLVFETLHRRRDGSPFPVEVSSRGTNLGGERVLLSIIRDITERKQAERARAKLAETLNAEISHRTKNNLAMVASILQMQAAEEREARVATLLTDAATRLMTFASIHEQLQTTHEGKVDLLSTMRRFAEVTREIFAAQHVEFTVEGESVALSSRAATNLAVVANELITNAAKHSDPEPDGVCRVRARLDTEDGTLHLVVWNSGGNVPPDFDVRAQARLGLRLVTALIVDQYGGEFTLRSDDGGTVAEARVDLASLE